MKSYIMLTPIHCNPYSRYSQSPAPNLRELPDTLNPKPLYYALPVHPYDSCVVAHLKRLMMARSQGGGEGGERGWGGAGENLDHIPKP